LISQVRITPSVPPENIRQVELAYVNAVCGVGERQMRSWSGQ
jgi:hypothetical protein